MKTYVVTPHWNRLDGTLLMKGHKICFNGEIGPVIPNLSRLPLLIQSTDMRSMFKARRGFALTKLFLLYLEQAWMPCE